MKLNEVLSSSGITVPVMADMILRKCGPFIRQIGWKNFLYRGIHPSTTDFSINDCPVNRKPKDTPQFFHDIADEWFLNEFGVRYRSNAVFASGSHQQAESYGTVYAIFPCGKFKFCWSVDVHDMTKEFKFLMTRAMNDEDEGVGRMMEALANCNYGEQDLQYARESGNEIMIHCGEYIMVDAEDGTLDNLVKYIDENTRNNIRKSPAN
jgi:hypothetical protein